VLLLTALLLAAEPVEAFDEHAFGDPEGDRSVLVHVDVTAGIIGAGRGHPADYGPLVSAGVPLHLGTRRPHLQFLVDSIFSVSYGLRTDRLLFVVTPTGGLNLYVFGWLGLEVRAGVALGMRWSAQTATLGLGYVLTGAVVLRPFDDDHARLKLVAVGQEILPLSNGSSALLTATAGLGFEVHI